MFLCKHLCLNSKPALWNSNDNEVEFEVLIYKATQKKSKDDFLHKLVGQEIFSGSNTLIYFQNSNCSVVITTVPSPTENS